ncbi:hypothetical protein MMC18_002249 [Xylographa bjoerkii]|nr:hypothetical protein [Xylographa bjoerkii]
MPRLRVFSSSLQRRLTSESLKPPVPYKALEQDSSTRVVQLKPGSGSQSIICNLEEILLVDEIKKYDAVSYTWGDLKKTRSIICSGSEVSVTAHLHGILHRLRRHDTDVALWIDQLCIDQSNVEERSRQVQLMEKIYNKAQSVVIWLGDEDAGSRTAFKLAREILALDAKQANIVLQRNNLESLGLPGWKSKDWQALIHFLKRPWFKRVWVMQEVVVSSHAMVVCGSESILWDDLVKVVKCVEYSGQSKSLTAMYKSNRLGGSDIIYMDDIREQQKQAQKANFLYLLMKCRARDATDPRDKVFALLGLSYYRITPDYSKADPEVYLELATYHVSQVLPGGRWKNTLSNLQKAEWIADLLFSAGNSDSEHLQSHLPSWVPDWSAGIERQQYGIGENRSIHPYRAGGDSLGEIEICHKTQLHLSGKLFDTVTMVGTARLSLEDGMWVKKHHRTISAWFEESNLIANYCPQPYPTGEPVGEVLKRTLIFGKTERGEEASREYVDTQYIMLINYLRGGWSCMDFGAFHEPHSQQLVNTAKGRILMLTKRGFLGLAPWRTRVGDTVCVLQGVPLPTILRGDLGHFKFMGECFVHGIMKGQVMNDNSIPIENIVLK